MTAVALAAGERVPGRPLGPRQRRRLRSWRRWSRSRGTGVPAAPVAERHGSSSIAGLVRRGLVCVQRCASVHAGRSRADPAGPRRASGRVLADGGARSRPFGSCWTRWRQATPRRSCSTASPAAARPRSTSRRSPRRCAAGRPALLLVPEIALATPDRGPAPGGPAGPGRRPALRPGRGGACRRVATDPRRATWTSSSGRERRSWRRSRTSGSIVVDEEHDAAYKSDRTPRFQARDAALELGRLAGAAVVLGSATPSVETMGHARSGSYRRAVLPVRAAGTEPVVTAVDMREELAAGNRGLISDALAGALAELDTGARGPGDPRPQPPRDRPRSSCAVTAAPFRRCPDCDRPLVYHQAGTTLRCHHCGRAWPVATRCPVVRLAADPLPRRGHGAGGARGARPVPGAAGRPPRPRHRGAQGRRRPRPRRLRRGPDGRARGHEPRRQGPRRRRRSRWSGSCRRTSHSTSPTSGRRSGPTSCSPRRWVGRAVGTGRGSPSSRPTGPEHRAIRAVVEGDAAGVLRRGARAPRAVRLAAVRAARQAHRRPPGARGGRARGPRDGGPAPGARPRPGFTACRSPDRRPRTSPGAATGGATTWSCGAPTRSRCSTRRRARRGPSTWTRSRCCERIGTTARGRRGQPARARIAGTATMGRQRSRTLGPAPRGGTR